LFLFGFVVEEKCKQIIMKNINCRGNNTKVTKKLRLENEPKGINKCINFGMYSKQNIFIMEKKKFFKKKKLDEIESLFDLM
jgi:hypothetical protein